jgi:pimeloyl-ACP methyl ester carboxylesterase
MLHRPFARFAILALLLPPATLHAAPAKARAEIPWRGKLAPCTLPEVPGKAYCRTYEVFENRAARAGRKIPLKIVLLPAKGPQRAPDPVFFLEGGPGAGATLDAGELASDPLRARRDIVLVDTRGTGGSAPLNCRLWNDGTRLDHIFPLDAVAACRDELKKRADLAQYTTAAAMDDVDEVRRYLGYGQVNLSGASYGTYAAQIFLTRHPEAVRTAVLSAVVKPGEPAPLNHARNAQAALELLAHDCAAEPACHAAFPHFQEEVSTVLDRLAKQPARVKVKSLKTGEPVEVLLSRSAAADALRWALYSPGPASQVPLRVHLAAQGDYRELARTAVAVRSQLQQYLALGLLFSVSCAEDLPRIDPKEIPAATRGTFYGDDRVREQLAVCGIWPHAPLPPDEGKLVHSDVPVLLFSGEHDPVTPPADAALVAQGFSRGLLVRIPGGTHAGGGACEQRLIADFVDRGSVQGLDVSCFKAAPRVPFVTSAKQSPRRKG